MNQVKRKLSLNDSHDEQIKIQRNINIEQQTYLDGCQMHHAFSYLNQRFQQLINSSSFLFKIKVRSQIDDVFIYDYKQIIYFNRQQIFSLNLNLPLNSNEFFSLNTTDSSFNHLESLVLRWINSNMLSLLLPKLKTLPRLYSLTIEMLNVITNLSEIYQVIFALPMLKYYKFSMCYTKSSISLSPATNKQFSPIEHLVIGHRCDFIELGNILSYTPQLRRLNVRYPFHYLSLIENVRPTTWPSLTHFSIMNMTDWMLASEDLETLFSKIYSKLKVLSFNIQFGDSDYLGAYRWEQLILKYIPQLEKFYFHYYESNIIRADPLKYIGESNQFTSSFWIDRKWIFEVITNIEDIKYSVRPYQEQLDEYDTQQKMIDSYYQLPKSGRLTILHINRDELITMNINRISIVSQIYHLEIREETIYAGMLIQIINLLPELQSLKIHSLSLLQSRNLSVVQLIILSTTSKITKIYLEKMVQIEEIYFLMALCPSLAYLKVDDLNNMDAEAFIRSILKKNNEGGNNYLSSLFLHVPIADDKMISKLDKIIGSDKLLLDYKLKLVLDNIYLQWK